MFGRRRRGKRRLEEYYAGRAGTSKLKMLRRRWESSSAHPSDRPPQPSASVLASSCWLDPSGVGERSGGARYDDSFFARKPSRVTHGLLDIRPVELPGRR